MMRRVPRCLRRLAIWLALWLVIGSARAPAQSIGYLVPDRFEVAPGTEIAVQLERGRAGVFQAIAWPRRDVAWFFVRAAGTQQNLEEPKLGGPDGESVLVELTEPDVAMIGMDRRPWVESVPGAGFREFLERDLAASALPAEWRSRAAADVLRVRHIESAKLLVRVARTVGGNREASVTASSKAGQRTEIRPLVDPTAMAVGSDLPMRISWSDSADVDARIVARQVSAVIAQVAATQKGTGFFTVTAPGTWQVEIHRAKWLASDPDADWELESATLCFVVPPAAKSARGGK